MKVCAFTKTYGDRKVLDMPEYNFEKGKIYAVIGANGSGKSTLAKILANVLPADQGFLPQCGTKVCLLPQKHFAFRMSTEANILLGGSDPAKAEVLMKALSIDHLAKKNAQHLSGGETARMALARLLMTDGDMLILDEPTSEMDMESILKSEALILRTCREQNCIIILVTHSLQQTKRLADRVLFFHNGTLLESGDRDRVLTAPSTRELRDFLEFYGQ